MASHTPARSRGFSTVEVLIALAMAALLLITVGGVLTSVRKLGAASRLRQQAVDYARQTLETINDVQNSPEVFACIGGTPGATCTATDSQTCAPPSAAYKSCWTACPRGLNGADCNSPLQLDSLRHLQKGAETLTLFTRTISIVNGADSNTKTVTVTVSWSDHGASQSVSLSTILTAWKSL